MLVVAVVADGHADVVKRRSGVEELTVSRPELVKGMENVEQSSGEQPHPADVRLGLRIAQGQVLNAEASDVGYPVWGR